MFYNRYESEEDMEVNKEIVIVSEGYDRIDGRNAYHSDIKRLTLGMPIMEKNKNMQIAMQIWKEKEDGALSIAMELPIHQIMDFMLFLSRTMLYFREAYRYPLLYNSDNPVIERIGVQGAVMPVNICIDNPDIDNDIKKFSQALSDLGELTGERMRTLSHIFEEMECY
jgi:hypothetical protein